MSRADAHAAEPTRGMRSIRWGAIALVSKAAVRRRGTAIAVIVAVAALVSGASLTAAAGARRTATVVDRMVAEFPTPDHTVSIYQTANAGDTTRLRAAEAALTELPGIDRAIALPGIFVAIGDGSWALQITTPLDSDFLDSGWTRPLRRGRLPAGDGGGEVAFDAATASRLGLEVGDEFVAPTIAAETVDAIMRGLITDMVADGPELRFTVVGIFRESVLDDPSFGYALASPDTARYLGRAGSSTADFAIDGDEVDITAARTVVAEAMGTSLSQSYSTDPDIELDPVRDTVGITAAGLALFALLGAAAGLFALGQIVGREVANAGRMAATARALGMRDRETAAAIALPSAVAAGAGIVAGALVASGLSPVFPTGQGRLAEPDLGVRIDWVVAGVGVPVLTAVVSVWSLLVARRRVGSGGGASRPVAGRRRSGLRRGIPVPAAIGSGSVLVSNRDRASVRPTSALLGTVLGITGVLAIAVFVASQHTTADDPARYGQNFDGEADVAIDDPDALFATLTEEPAIAAVGVMSCGASRVDAYDALLCGWDVLSGSIPMTYLAGRAPSSPAEIAAGRTTAADLGIRIGDRIEVTGIEATGERGTTRSLEVVGLVVNPVPSDPGTGLVATPDTAQALIGDDASPTVMLTYAPEVAPDVVQQILADSYGLTSDELASAAPPLLLERLDLVRPTLVALAVLLGALGAIGLVHFLLLSNARRRRETAVLRALGFVRLQTIGVVVWQGLTIASIGLIIGAPLGIVLGRSVWVASIDQLGIVDNPTVPWRFAALVLMAALLIAGSVGLLSGWRAARTAAAAGLHDE